MLLLLHPGFIKWWCSIQQCKVLQQQAVDKDVSTSYFVEQEPLGGFVEKGNDIPRQTVRAPEPKAQGEVLKKATQPKDQPDHGD